MDDNHKQAQMSAHLLARLGAAILKPTYRPARSGNMQLFVAITLPFLVLYVITMIGMFDEIEGPFDQSGHILGRDFINYWTASILANSDRLMVIFDLDLFHEMQQRLLDRTYRFHMWSYPPTAIFTILPLGHLPYLWAFALWMTVTLAVYLFAARQLGATGIELVVLALTPASFINFFAGQNGFLTAGLLVMGLAQLDRRPWCAGVMFGLLSFKPQLGLLIPVALCAAGLWRPFLAAALTTIALFTASVAAFGWESWQGYLGENAIAQAIMLHDSLQAFIVWMPTAFMAGQILDLGPAVSYAVQGIFSVCALAGVFWIYRQTDDRGMQAAALLTGTVLVTPYLHVYDLTLLSVAVLWAGRRAYREGFFPGESFLYVAAWVLPILVFAMNRLEVPVAPLIILAFFASILIRVHAAGPVAGQTRHPVIQYGRSMIG